jgi:hypothetical protein
MYQAQASSNGTVKEEEGFGWGKEVTRHKA